MQDPSLLVIGGRVFVDGGLRPADLLIRAGRIEAIAEGLASRQTDSLVRWNPAGTAPGALPVLELQGEVVLPGLIDSQVHFREPGLSHKEDLESGSRAAVAGGITAFLEMPNTHPATISAEALADKVRRAEGRAWCDFGFFVGACAENAERLAELERLPGCCGVKVFMGASTGSLLVPDDGTLRRVLAGGRRRVAVHAEDEPRLLALKAAHPEADHPRWHPRLRDEECSLRAVQRLLRLARETGRPIHVLHVSCAEELEALRPFAGNPALGVEVTPQHLLLTAPACYEELGTRAQMNPPIRGERHRAALWQALRDGLVRAVGSDHAPHTAREKARPYPASPSGLPGVETLLPLLLDLAARGELSLAEVVRLLGEGPAELYCIEGKGRLAEGLRGDLSIVDLDEEWTVDEQRLQSRCGWSPFHGRRLRGRATATVLRGRVVFRRGALLGPPAGRPLKYTDLGEESPS
jgi:dihydroorotase